MKLTLVKLGALIVIRFAVPGEGDWYVYSLDAAGKLATIEYCGRSAEAQPVAWIVPANETNRVFQAVWFGRAANGR